jgi:hypothetical protein
VTAAASDQAHTEDCAGPDGLAFGAVAASTQARPKSDQSRTWATKRPSTRTRSPRWRPPFVLTYARPDGDLDHGAVGVDLDQDVDVAEAADVVDHGSPQQGAHLATTRITLVVEASRRRRL